MKRKIMCFLLSVVLTASLCSMAVPAAEDVITITTPAQLNSIRDNLSGHYKLGADIVFQASDFEKGGDFYNNGEGFVPIAAENDYVYFTGTFDGQGYSIKGLKIAIDCDDTNALVYLGLFGRNKGEIRNLKLEDVDFSMQASKPDEVQMQDVHVGGIAAQNMGTISSCGVSGNIRAVVNGKIKINAGGIAAHNGAEIQDCFNTASVSGSGDQESLINVGGIVGYAAANHVTTESVVERCYNVGAVSASTLADEKKYLHAGGVVGYNYGAVRGCYYLDNAEHGIDYDTAANQPIKITAAQLLQQQTFADFDFKVIWEMGTNGPTLKIFKTHIQHEHTWDAGTVTKKATCTEKGDKLFTCSVCQTVRHEEIPALGHDFAKEFTVDKAATKDAAGEKSRHCTRCDARTEITAIPKLRPTVDSSKIFKDVPKKAWYKGAVDFAYGNGLFTGESTTMFAPEANMTRAMFVTVLGRMAGVSVDKNAKTKFTDVKQRQWYTGYVKWASDNGIVNGVSSTKFAPEENVTREQICKMMVTYCKFAGITLKNINKPIVFKDNAKISGWAKQYVQKCQTAGLVNGSGGYFNPQGNATRAEVATILMNFDKNYHVL